jgi:hypothetical protein
MYTTTHNTINQSLETQEISIIVEYKLLCILKMGESINISCFIYTYIFCVYFLTMLSGSGFYNADG